MEKIKCVYNQKELEAAEAEGITSLQICFGTKSNPAKIFWGTPLTYIYITKDYCLRNYDNSVKALKIYCEDESSVRTLCGDVYLYGKYNIVEAFNNTRVFIANENSAPNIILYDQATLTSVSFVTKNTCGKVVAYDNAYIYNVSVSKMELHDHAMAYDLNLCPFLVAKDFSTVRLELGNKLNNITLYDFATLEASNPGFCRCGVAAHDNSRIISSIDMSGSLRDKATSVDIERNLWSYLDSNHILYNASKRTAVFYKYADKDKSGLYSFNTVYSAEVPKYNIGDIVIPYYGFDPNSYATDSLGITVYPFYNVLTKGRDYDFCLCDNPVLLALEVDIASIVIPCYTQGECRVPKAKILREVPKKEIQRKIKNLDF
jgi:hypothetical protein